MHVLRLPRRVRFFGRAADGAQAERSHRVAGQAPRDAVTLGDAKARDLIQTTFDKTLVVEAAAGTGKTTELVGRIVALLRSGRTT
ncbi:MAG: UvrD-helicase domain-containing protein, partial [Myxococcales bacterium]